MRDQSQIVVEALAEAVVSAEAAYVAGNPVMSDAAWDALVRRLTALAPDHPVLVRVGPTPQAGGVPHLQPMRSLAKAADREHLGYWLDDHAGQPMVVSPKIDGVALSVRYDSAGRLLGAATRGDGLVGQDVTAAVLAGRLVPTALANWSGGELELRGEVWLERGSGAELVARTAHLLLGHQVAGRSARELRLQVWDVLGEGLSDSLTGRLQLAGVLGFASVPVQRVDSAAAAQSALRRLATSRKLSPWESDGAVLRLDSSAAMRAAGGNRHHPHGAVAWKWKH